MKDPFRNRRYVITAIFSLMALVFVVRLFYLQVIDKSLTYSSENNSRRYVTQYPARGLVLDRNGKTLVFNEASYDLMVTPRMVAPFDTVDFCRILGITPEVARDNLKQARAYSRYKPSVFLRQISARTYAVLQEKLHKFVGFYVQPRTSRLYTRPIAPHLLGYVSEVNDKIIASNSYYKMGDYIGVSGIEKAYEETLRGKKGVKILLVDVHNVEKGSFQEGAYDTTAVVGRDIICTIDGDLQEYGEYLMQNMRGSVVAIEPSTGEILAMISMPKYDPNLLVGRERSGNYLALERSEQKVLLNRAVNARYSPGSTFKPAQALVSLEMGGITESSMFPSNGKASSPMACSHDHGSPVSLLNGIEQSCNPYFWHAFRETLEKGGTQQFRKNYNDWRDHMLKFGFGRKLESDIPNISDGNLPTQAYFDHWFGVNRWRPMTIRSLAIGQGEILVTPLQQANYMAALANRGFYYPPHTVRTDSYSERINVDIASRYIDVVVEGMRRVNESGTGRGSFSPTVMQGITSCGKTGTVENPPHKDHSLFVGFAPVENPKIAIAVVVENAGFGATWAAPVASLMIEKYLAGTVKRPELEARVINFSIY
ncbi:MAG: penicillin-binding transpeptidase domain-containing protein [Bacteroidales bacterium]